MGHLAIQLCDHSSCKVEHAHGNDFSLSLRLTVDFETPVLFSISRSENPCFFSASREASSSAGVRSPICH